MHSFIQSFNLYCFQIKIKCQGGVEKIGMAVDKNYHNPHNKLSKKKDNSNCVTIVKKIFF